MYYSLAAPFLSGHCLMQVETDLPELRQQLRDLVGLVASRDQQPGSQETEQAVRRVVNTTLLPEVLERQVGRSTSPAASVVIGHPKPATRSIGLSAGRTTTGRG
jgi:hypothetical protein